MNNTSGLAPFAVIVVSAVIAGVEHWREGRHYSCRVSSGGSVVLVNEPAESVVAVDPGRA